jgi:RHS repeat-associated protein
MWETRYTAYRLDVECGLYSVRFRFFHPVLGTWITRDPYLLHEPIANNYLYSSATPIVLRDPLGLFFLAVLAIPIAKIFVAALAALVIATVATKVIDEVVQRPRKRLYSRRPAVDEGPVQPRTGPKPQPKPAPGNVDPPFGPPPIEKDRSGCPYTTQCKKSSSITPEPVAQRYAQENLLNDLRDEGFTNEELGGYGINPEGSGLDIQECFPIPDAKVNCPKPDGGMQYHCAVRSNGATVKGLYVSVRCCNCCRGNRQSTECDRAHPNSRFRDATRPQRGEEAGP